MIKIEDAAYSTIRQMGSFQVDENLVFFSVNIKNYTTKLYVCSDDTKHRTYLRKNNMIELKSEKKILKF